MYKGEIKKRGQFKRNFHLICYVKRLENCIVYQRFITLRYYIIKG